jgi:hypothetical protein
MKAMSQTPADMKTKLVIFRPHPGPLPQERVSRRPFVVKLTPRLQISAKGKNAFHRGCSKLSLSYGAS